MEVIIPVTIISAIITYYCVKWTNRVWLAYILMIIIMNIVFYIQGYYAVGYTDPFAPIAHFFLTITTLFGCFIGQVIWIYFNKRNKN